MAKEKKPIKISGTTLRIFEGIFGILLGTFIILSPNTFFSFFSVPIVLLFGSAGFWIFVPFIIILGILKLIKTPKLKVNINLVITGASLIVAFTLILLTNILVEPFILSHEGVELNFLNIDSMFGYFSEAHDLIKTEASASNPFNYIYVEHSSYLAGGLFGYTFAGLLNSIANNMIITLIISITMIAVGVVLIFHYQIGLFIGFLKRKAEERKKALLDKEDDTDEVTLVEEESYDERRTLPYDRDDEATLKSDRFERAIPYDEDNLKPFNPLELETTSFNNTHSLTKAVFKDALKSEEEEKRIAAPHIEDSIVEEKKSEEIKVIEEVTPIIEKEEEVKEETIEETFEKEEEPVIEEEVKEAPIIKEEVKAKPIETPKIPTPVKEEKPLKKPYVLPSVTLLDKHESIEKQSLNKESCDRRVNEINQIFNELSIGAQVVSYTVGPTVTQYDVLMNSDKSISMLDRFIDDIQIRLGGIPIRFEKLVAGKRTSGLEMENEIRTTVGLRECVEDLSPLTPQTRFEVPFGRGINGGVVKANFTKFPHLLVAGTTGSGKSVFLHSLLVTLLLRNTPDELRLLLIDPKVVEMNYYKNIPHLLCPNISEANQAKVALNKLCELMDERYRMFSDIMANDIKTYNRLAESKGLEKMPYIVVLIDEYADLNDECKDIRMPVSRLAQKARTAGIHLIVATQRPSVNVIDGVIKSNITCRVALKVSSHTDSQVILGEVGAEKLCGNGDMIISIPEISNSIKPRVQGCFVDIEEIIKVTDKIRATGEPNFDPRFLDLEENNSEDSASSYSDSEVRKVDKDMQEEELYQMVKEDIMNREYCSISYIQRTYSVGFNKAGRLMLRLQKEKYVAFETDSSHGCRVLIKKEKSSGGLGSIEQTDFKIKD